MDNDNPSPFTKASCGSDNPFTGKPSMSAMSGFTFKASNAKPIARCVARKMLIRSISSASTVATDQIISGFPVISS